MTENSSKIICLHDGQYYSTEKYADIIKNFSSNEDILTLTPDGTFKLDFVGIILCREQPVIVFPKDYPIPENSEERTAAARLLVHVILQYRNDPLIPKSDKVSFNGDRIHNTRIITAIELLDAYCSNGLIYRHKSEEGNYDKGVTLWGKTVSRMNPIIAYAQVLYDKPIRRIEKKDYFHPVTLIHGCVINECARLWDWVEGRKVNRPVAYSRMPYSVNEAVYLLKRELSVTYNQTEIRTINLLITYLEGKSAKTANGISVAGTYDYEYVWESICGYIFDSRYRELKGIIPQPTWKGLPWSISQRPDVISVEGDTLYILDAKYRSASRDTIGWYDAAKQYLYAFTAKETLKSGPFAKMLPEVKRIGNAFIFGSSGVIVDENHPHPQ